RASFATGIDSNCGTPIALQRRAIGFILPRPIAQKRICMPTRTSLLALALLVLALPLRAEVVANTDYKLLDPPQHSDSPGKIEVIEFFSYGCPHCNEFYPLVTSWAAKLPKDVAFKRVATGFGRTAWTNLAKAFYALQSTGDLAR